MHANMQKIIFFEKVVSNKVLNISKHLLVFYKSGISFEIKLVKISHLNHLSLVRKAFIQRNNIQCQQIYFLISNVSVYGQRVQNKTICKRIYSNIIYRTSFIAKIALNKSLHKTLLFQKQMTKLMPWMQSSHFYKSIDIKFIIFG